MAGPVPADRSLALGGDDLPLEMPAYADPPEPLPVFTKLQASALRLFAAKGYDGAHVSDIARGAGIRKSSVYAHCQSKEDLFMGLLRRVMGRELRVMCGMLVEGGLLDGLNRYFVSLKDRLDEDPPCYRFLLRSVYTPPLDLSEPVSALGMEFFPDLIELFKRALADHGAVPESLDLLAEATLSVMDSVHVASLYCPQFFGKRLDAVWAMYEKLVSSP
ncbi:MAG: TetR/AcrR family transcriptional regulator [Deltaproteobacteria bacterium]|jgi:AcrR family transcriptional regulator|nr:TetR/AcrR family transcriptional regulator [Deltaproteobacteria bacterium]